MRLLSHNAELRPKGVERSLSVRLFGEIFTRKRNRQQRNVPIPKYDSQHSLSDKSPYCAVTSIDNGRPNDLPNKEFSFESPDRCGRGEREETARFGRERVSGQIRGFSVAPMRQASAKRKRVRPRSQPHDLERMLLRTVQPSEGVRYPIRVRHTHNGRRKAPDLRSGE